MDLQPIHNQEATSSSSSQIQHLVITEPSASSSTADSKALRSSARVKAAKQKEQDKGKDRDSAEQATSSSAAQPLLDSSISTRATRSSQQATRAKRARDTDVKGKGKAKDFADETTVRASKRQALIDLTQVSRHC